MTRIDTMDCQLWDGRLNADGYGYIQKNRRRFLAHRMTYEAARGPIPAGLQIDHLCRNRACVNPDHMEPVTSAVNTLRGEGPTAINARKTRCGKGHELSAANVYLWRNSRHCRICRRERKVIARRLRKEGRQP